MTDYRTDPHWGLPDPDTQSEFYADVPTKRLIAFIVDTVVILLITLLIVPFTAFTAIFFIGGLAWTVNLIYRIATIASGSATWGMRLAGIEFRNSRGEKFDLGMAMLHTGLYTAWTSLGLPQLVSIVMILATERRQSLSDMILGTAAVNKAARF